MLVAVRRLQENNAGMVATGMGENEGKDGDKVAVGNS